MGREIPVAKQRVLQPELLEMEQSLRRHEDAAASALTRLHHMIQACLSILRAEQDLRLREMPEVLTLVAHRSEDCRFSHRSCHSVPSDESLWGRSRSRQ